MPTRRVTRGQPVDEKPPGGHYVKQFRVSLNQWTNWVVRVKRFRLLDGRRTLAPLCAALLAVAGVGTWALLRTSTPTSPTSSHSHRPAVEGSNGTVTGGSHSTATTGSETSTPSASPSAVGTSPGLQAGTSNQVGPNGTLQASAQPGDVLPEVPSVLLIPAIALVVFGTVMGRNHRRQRRLGRLEGAGAGQDGAPSSPIQR